MAKRMTKAQREEAQKAALLQRVRDVLIGAPTAVLRGDGDAG